MEPTPIHHVTSHTNMPTDDITSDKARAVRSTVGEIADATQRSDETYTITRQIPDNPKSQTNKSEYPVINIEVHKDALNIAEIDPLPIAEVRITPHINAEGGESQYTGYNITVQLSTYDYTDFPPFDTTWEALFDWGVLNLEVTDVTEDSKERFPHLKNTVTAQTPTEVSFEKAVYLAATFMESLRDHRTDNVCENP